MGWTTRQAVDHFRRLGIPDAIPRACGEPAKRSKFNAEPTMVDGIRFASKREARHYQTVKIAEAHGLLTELRLQPRYELQAKYTDAHGKKHRALVYVGDFEFLRDGQRVCVDSKGVLTPVFRTKAKLFSLRYPHILLETW